MYNRTTRTSFLVEELQQITGAQLARDPGPPALDSLALIQQRLAERDVDLAGEDLGEAGSSFDDAKYGSPWNQSGAQYTPHYKPGEEGHTAPTLDDLRKKKERESDGKTWTKLTFRDPDYEDDVAEYEYKGKKGVWRTSKSGRNRLFIPADGSDPMGHNKKYLDKLSGQLSLFDHVMEGRSAADLWAAGAVKKKKSKTES